jgi:PBSX family phage terminase large subunit
MSPEGAQFIGTTNPDSPFHWYKKNFLDKGPDANISEEEKLDIQIYNFTLDDNLTLTDTYKRNLCKEFNGVFYKRFILGLWCIAEGQIYDMFSEITHVFPNDTIPDFPRVDEWSLAVDYGAGNPTRFGLYGHDSKLNVDYLLREYSYDPRKEQRQKSASQYKVDLIDFVEKFNYEVTKRFTNEAERKNYLCPDAHKLKVYVDPSATTFITELYSSVNGSFTGVIKANNAVLAGICYMQTRFTERRFFIHESCKCDLQEVTTYGWDAKAVLKGEDKPVKKDDHSMDRDRYYLYTRKKPRQAKNKLVGKGVR